MRRRKAALKAVKELDVFPKVQDDYQKPTARGGTLSIITLLAIFFLVVSEFSYYRSTEIKYEYSVDTDMDSKLLLTVDMTVAMSCDYLGADIIDLAGESKQLTTTMKLEPAYFELSEYEWMILRQKRELLTQYRSLSDLPIIEKIVGVPVTQPTARNPSVKPDSCRLYGSIEVNKVAGNFHITTGKSIPHPQGHAHLNMFIPNEARNFSHRIDHLSFGPPVPGALNPLDGTLKITKDRHHLFQYYMQVVPTKLSTYSLRVSTNQYSVNERNRTINHVQGSHGIAGVFFKYDLSSMTVDIREERRPFWQFLVRLCGIVGGVFATSGMLNAVIGMLMDRVTGKRKEVSSQLTLHNSDNGGTKST